MAKPDLPESLAIERDAIIAEIHAAWKGVTRDGGVSWSETWCIGDFLDDTPEDRAAARDNDNELNWQELVDDPPWTNRHHPVYFLDPIASRYYIAPMLVCRLQGKEAVHIEKLLLLQPDGFDSSPERWSLLDSRQRVCIARFLTFMHRSCCFEHGVHFRFNNWYKILQSYWKQFDQTQ